MAVVLSLYDSGLNLIPIKADGSRAPKVRWTEYQTTQFPRYRLAEWFGCPGNPSGIAIVCGQTSGNLEILDFDVYRVWPLWSGRVGSLLPGLLATLPIVQTPSNGRHVYYRCEVIKGSEGLAWDKDQHVLIEIKGQGGLATAPGSPLSTHASGKPYRVEQGDIRSIPTITPEQREVLVRVAREFNVYTPKVSVIPKKTKLANLDLILELYGEWPLPPETRPGDDFNQRGEWADILEPHGWTMLKVRNGVMYWRKPGSGGTQHHATTNFDGKDQLVVYSTSVQEFETSTPGEPPVCYSKFSAYAILNHKGDFSKAAKQLRNKGYGLNNKGDEE